MDHGDSEASVAGVEVWDSQVLRVTLVNLGHLVLSECPVWMGLKVNVVSLVILAWLAFQERMAYLVHLVKEVLLVKMALLDQLVNQE